MKTTKSFSMDVEYLIELEKQAKERKMKINDLIVAYILGGISLNRYFEVACSCGSKYSSKLTNCPGCNAIKPE